MDYGELNKKTLNHSGSIPNVESTLEKIGSCRYKTKMDKRSGFWQVDLTPNAQELLAFITPQGRVFKWKVMLFGVANAPPLFQELMNKILSILQRRPKVQELISRGAQMEAHIDDVCLGTNTVLGALQNHEEGRRKVKSMPTWVNLSQGGSTLHSPEATEKKASTTRAGVRGKDPQPVVSGRRAKNLAEILSSYKKTKKPKKRPRAKPAAKEPPKKKARLLPGESSESEEFEETEEDEEEEPPSGDEEEEPPARDDDDEDETQETQIPDRGALPWAWLPLQQEDQWGAWRGVPISKWRPWRTEIPRDILQQKTKLGRAGTIFWVPADYNSAMWHSVGEYCVAARSYATEEECKNAAAVASATGGVPAPSARKKKVKAKRPKKKKKTPTKSGGKQEEEDAGEGDKEDKEKKDEVAVLVSGSES